VSASVAGPEPEPRSALVGSLSISTLAVIFAVPVVATLWIAVDNAVFLVAPVRFVPGQGNTMHHTGRAMVMVFVRILLMVGLSLVSALAAFGVSVATERTGMEPLFRYLLMALAVVLVLFAAVAGVIAMGGWALARYDVAREQASMA